MCQEAMKGQDDLVSETAAAPIALYVYNRPDHLQRVAQALARNALAARSALYVFVDAP